MSNDSVKLSDGKLIPNVGWGTAMMKNYPSEEVAYEKCLKALQKGMKHIDTASFYGTEHVVGRALKDSGVNREEVWITTKISPPGLGYTKQTILPFIQERLKKLGTTPDLLLIHTPFIIENGRLHDFWKVLEGLVLDDEKLLQGVSLGVSNFRVEDLTELLACKGGLRIKPVVNQIEFHPYVSRDLEPLIELCKAHDIIIEGFSPLTPLLRYPKNKGNNPILPVLERIADRLTSTWTSSNENENSTGEEKIDSSTVLLLWVIQKGHIVITNTFNDTRYHKLSKMNDSPKLLQSEIDEIDQVGKTIHFRYYKMSMESLYIHGMIRILSKLMRIAKSFGL